MADTPAKKYELSRRDRLHANTLEIGKLYGLRFISRNLKIYAQPPVRIMSLESYKGLEIQKVCGKLVSKDWRTRDIFFGMYDGCFLSFSFIHGPEEFVPGWPIEEGHLVPDAAIASTLPRGALRALMREEIAVIEHSTAS